MNNKSGCINTDEIILEGYKVEKKRMAILQRNFTSLFTSFFFLGGTTYAASQCDPKYFTTWALYLHCAVFGVFAAFRCYEFSIEAHEGCKLKHDVYLWIFSPSFSTAVCVLATASYLLVAAWAEAYNEYCLPDEMELDKKNACLDFALEFTITHSGPPVLLALFAFIDRGAVSRAREKIALSEVQKDRFLYAGHVFLTTALFPFVYGLFFKVSTVYGAVSEVVTTVIFALTNAIVSISCAFYFAEMF